MNHPIIGIFGQVCVGKTTLAGMLYREWMYYHQPTANPTDPLPMISGFAHAIKHSYASIFGVTTHAIEKWKRDDVPMSDKFIVNTRTGLQLYGQLCREIMPTVWIDKCLGISTIRPLIVDDGRYLNEFDAIKSAGGYCIVMDRLGHLGGSTHASETGIGEILRYRTADCWVHNNESLRELENNVKKVLFPSILKYFKESSNAPTTN